jgi:hypothetical protein
MAFNITITSGPTTNVSAAPGGGKTTFTPIADDAILNSGDIMVAFGAGDVEIVTVGTGGAQDGDIVLGASVFNSSGSTRLLQLRAQDDIVLNSDIAGGGAGLHMEFVANDRIDLNNLGFLQSDNRSIQFFSGNGIGLAGVVDAGASSGLLVLNAGVGAITQTGPQSIITAAALRVVTTGAVSLTQASNNIGNISEVSANGFALVDTGGLSFNGTINGGTGTASIYTTGSISAFASISGQAGVTLTAAADNSTLYVDQAIASPASVTLTADQLVFASGFVAGNSSNTIPTASATIQPFSVGRAIALGGSDANLPTGSGGVLGISVPDLNAIRATTITIGNATAGNITISSAVDAALSSTLILHTAGTITQTAGSSIAEVNLGLIAEDGISLNQSGNAAQNISGRVTGFGDFAYQDSNSAFTVINLSSVNSGTTGIQTTNGSIFLTGTQVNLGADLRTEGGGNTANQVTINGAVVLTAGNVTIDTDQDGTGQGGAVGFLNTINAQSAGSSSLTIDASSVTNGQ